MHAVHKPLLALSLALGLIGQASAFDISGKLRLTGGVSQIEGSGGGGLTPWALIGTQATRDQVGANAFYTTASTQDYRLDTYGVMIGLFDRVELSLGEQAFDTQSVGTKLGLGRDFTFRQQILGAKVRVLGDAVLEQDSWLPQIALGVQHKRNNQNALVTALGAKKDSGLDVYAAATKLFLGQSLLANVTLRATKANQGGLLGFGGDRSDRYHAQWEGSLAWLARRDLALGVEYRQKPNNLKFAREQDWADVFVAWAPIKNLSLTVAWVSLGDIATIRHQRGWYGSVQVGF